MSRRRQDNEAAVTPHVESDDALERLMVANLLIFGLAEVAVMGTVTGNDMDWSFRTMRLCPYLSLSGIGVEDDVTALAGAKPDIASLASKPERQIDFRGDELLPFFDCRHLAVKGDNGHAALYI